MTNEPERLGRRRFRSQLEDSGDEGGADDQLSPAPGGTLMSHLSSPGSILALSSGVVASAAGALLVALGGAADGVAPREESAAIEAIDVAAITASADEDLLAATGAVIETMGRTVGQLS